MRPRDTLITLGSLALIGCVTPHKVNVESLGLPEVSQVDPTLSPLTWVGGISILGGIILMTVTRFLGLPLRGAIPLLAGIVLVVGAWVLQTYADIAILPIAITSGVVGSLAVALSAYKLWRSFSWKTFLTAYLPTPEHGSSSMSSVDSPHQPSRDGSSQQ
jgi:hypothetical protein